MSMQDVRKRGADALAKVDSSPGAKPMSPGGRAITSPGAMAMMQPTIDALNERTKAAEQESRDLKILAANNPIELAFDQLIEIEGRKRRLTPNEFEELRLNLEQNEMVHPVVVRPSPAARSEGSPVMYEVISGYNRLAIYRLLGRGKVPVRVLPLEDDDADDASFWANLMQPSLPDYEKFLGFKRVQDRHSLNQSQLSKKAGVSKAQLSRMFAFEDLPAAVADILEAQPHILGCDSASALAQLTRAGKVEQVIEAVRELAAGRLTQDGAVSAAAAGVIRSAERTGRLVKANTTQIRSGMADYCRIVSRGTSLRLEFKSEEQRAIADEAVEKLLRELAERFGASRVKK